MMRTIAILAAAVTALIAAAPARGQGDTGTHEPGADLLALATLGGDGGLHGIVDMQARPGQATRTRGILIGLSPQGMQSLRLAFSDEPCGSTDAAYAPLRASIAVRPDGTALMEEEGIFYARALRRAVSLALLGGDPDRPVIVGCAALQKFRADPSARERDDVLLSAGQLAAGPSLLANLLADADGPALGAAVLRGLTPDTQYGLALAGQGGIGGADTCYESSAKDAVPLGSAVADPTGAVLIALESDSLTNLSLRDDRSLLVTLPGPGPDETVVVACATVQSAAVRELG